MANSIELKFGKTQKEFLEFLKYTKGSADTTCYNYKLWFKHLDSLVN